MRATRRSPFSHPSRTLAHPAREARVLKQHGVGEGESEVRADFRNGCHLWPVRAGATIRRPPLRGATGVRWLNWTSGQAEVFDPPPTFNSTAFNPNNYGGSQFVWHT